MKKYIVLEMQEGGCDYTIGCGKNWEIIEADSIKEALDKYLNDEDYDDDFKLLDGESSPNEIEIYEIGEHLGIETCLKIYNAKLQVINNKRDEEDEKQKREDEIRTLKRLKKKYPTVD